MSVNNFGLFFCLSKVVVKQKGQGAVIACSLIFILDLDKFFLLLYTRVMALSGTCSAIGLS